MTRSPVVSLCLIAKNEQHCIGRCMDSVRHLVDEIIVVDTGSSDATREIAAARADKVLDFTWCDDFSAARNFALEQALGEWIFVLDADEVLARVARETFFALLVQAPVEGFYVRILNYLHQGAETTEDFVVRLFRNKTAYRFAGAIHEQVVGSIREHNADGGIAFSPLVIHHFGYLDREVKGKDKFARNSAIIISALKHNPHDPFLHYNLGIEYLQHDRISLANEQFYKAVGLLAFIINCPARVRAKRRSFFRSWRYGRRPRQVTEPA